MFGPHTAVHGRAWTVHTHRDIVTLCHASSVTSYKPWATLGVRLVMIGTVCFISGFYNSPREYLLPICIPGYGMIRIVPHLGVPQQSLPIDSIDSDNHHRFRQLKSLFAGQSHPLLRHLGHSKARCGGQFLGFDQIETEIGPEIWGSFFLGPNEVRATFLAAVIVDAHRNTLKCCRTT